MTIFSVFRYQRKNEEMMKMEWANKVFLSIKKNFSVNISYQISRSLVSFTTDLIQQFHQSAANQLNFVEEL